MKFTILKNQIKIQKNTSIFFLLILAVISVLSMQIYNLNKKKINENYSELIHNTYFQKTFNHIFNNLEPRYANIKHTVSEGETIDKILKNYQISEKEIAKLIKELSPKLVPCVSALEEVFVTFLSIRIRNIGLVTGNKRSKPVKTVIDADNTFLDAKQVSLIGFIYFVKIIFQINLINYNQGYLQ